MSHPLTDDPTNFPGQVTSPDNGDDDIAESVEVGLQALADRTAHIHSGDTVFTGSKLFEGPLNRATVNVQLDSGGFPAPSALLMLKVAATLAVEDGNVLPDSDAQIRVDPTNTDLAGIIRYVGTIGANRKYWVPTSAATVRRGTIVVVVHGDDITHDATVGYSADGGTTVTGVVVLPANLWGAAVLHRAGSASAPDRWRLLMCAGAAVPQAGA